MTPREVRADGYRPRGDTRGEGVASSWRNARLPLNGRPGANRTAWKPGTMPHFIHQHSTRVRASDGSEYCARTYGKARADGTWSGWIEFVPTDGRAIVLSTEQETSQPDRRAVEYWAGGLEPVYLQGALQRALNRSALGEDKKKRGASSALRSNITRAAPESP